MGRKPKEEGEKREIIHTFKSTNDESLIIDRVCQHHRLPKSEAIRKLFKDADQRLTRYGEMIAVNKAYRLLPFDEQKAFNLSKLQAEKAKLEADLQLINAKLAECNDRIAEWQSTEKQPQLIGGSTNG